MSLKFAIFRNPPLDLQEVGGVEGFLALASDRCSVASAQLCICNPRSGNGVFNSVRPVSMNSGFWVILLAAQENDVIMLGGLLRRACCRNARDCSAILRDSRTRRSWVS